MSQISRRSMAGAALLLGAGLVGGACGTSGGSSGAGSTGSEGGYNSGGNQKIVLSTFPFGIEAIKKAVVEPFTKATGIQVEIETGSNAERLQKLELNKKSPKVDVVMISDFFAASGQAKDVFVKVERAKVPNMAKLSKFAADEKLFGPAYTYQLNGMLYRTDLLKAEEVAEWEIFSDPKVAKKFAMPDYAATSGQLTLSALSFAYGSGPFDVDKGFAKLKSWSPNCLKFYTSSTEVTSLLQRKEILVAPSIQGFATPLVKAGEPIGWVPVKKGNYMATNRLMIAKGTKNTDAAHKFIDYYLSAEAQQAAAEQVNDNPVRNDVKVPELLTKVAGQAATDPEAAGFKALDMEPIVKDRSKWSDRYAREVAGK